MTDVKWYEEIIHSDGKISRGKIGAILCALGSIGAYLLGTIDFVTAITQAGAALGIFGIRHKL